jgi:immune inhibitor A
MRCKKVPPSPEVLAYLVYEYRRKWKDLGFTFEQFLVAAGYDNPAHDHRGMDDGAVSVWRSDAD